MSRRFQKQAVARAGPDAVGAAKNERLRLFSLACSVALALALALGSTGAAQAETVRYTLDPEHTQVDFRWHHLGLSTPAASMERVRGMLLWDAQDPTASKVSVTLPVAGVHTRVPELDARFRSADYFDAEKHPDVTFESTKVERTGIGDRYRITGNLTLRGITKPVVLEAVLNGRGMHPMYRLPAVGFDATGTLRRSDFGLNEGLPIVADEIELRITAEAIEAQGFEKARASEAARSSGAAAGKP